ncbi:hypothetical protein [Streptomyces sp. NPDC001744]|uniref:hypothetical protein n=1 Tax=Streptomyces sp. NPDC001744 TaxID=3364606 RepID=UPI00369276DA
MAIAVLLLPLLGLLLFLMDRIEDRVTSPPRGSRHAGRHLRLVAGAGRAPGEDRPARRRPAGRGALPRAVPAPGTGRADAA